MSKMISTIIQILAGCLLLSSAFAQSANLQFKSDGVFVSVEQGGTANAIIQIHNYGTEAGSATLLFAGQEPDGITVELSTTSITDLGGNSYQNITATITATASLYPLGPRRLDISLTNGTTELDSMYLEMDVIAPQKNDNQTSTSSLLVFIMVSIITIVLAIILALRLRH